MLGSEALTAEQAIKAIEHYELNVLAPTASGVKDQSRWYVCSTDRTRYGFGSTAIEAIEAATKHKP